MTAPDECASGLAAEKIRPEADAAVTDYSVMGKTSGCFFGSLSAAVGSLLNGLVMLH